MLQGLLAKGEKLLSRLGEVVAPVQTETQELLIAIRRRDWHRSLELLESGAVDALSKEATGGDLSPLHAAAAEDFVECVEYLLDTGCDVNGRDGRLHETPLHHGARRGHFRICRLLVDRGASLVARNAKHQTAYDVAQDLSLRQWLLPLQLQAEAELEPPKPHTLGGPPQGRPGGAGGGGAGYPAKPQDAASQSIRPLASYDADFDPAQPTARVTVPYQLHNHPAVAVAVAAGCSTAISGDSSPSSQLHNPTNPSQLQVQPPPSHLQHQPPLGLHQPPPQRMSPVLLQASQVPPAAPQLPAPLPAATPPQQQQQISAPPQQQQQQQQQTVQSVGPPAALPSQAGGPHQYSHVSKRQDAYGRPADGFHSSSSDPILAAKYGHTTKNFSHLPPPPVITPPPGGAGPGLSALGARRYVSYAPQAQAAFALGHQPYQPQSNYFNPQPQPLKPDHSKANSFQGDRDAMLQRMRRSALTGHEAKFL